jgi:hypothetical protein
MAIHVGEKMRLELYSDFVRSEELEVRWFKSALIASRRHEA